MRSLKRSRWRCQPSWTWSPRGASPSVTSRRHWPPRGHCVRLYRLEGDLNLGGRNCDRAVKRSTPLEAVHQVLGLLLVDAAQLQANLHFVEQVHVWSDARAW